ncbi:GH3 auxin-responsive promoter family protein [Hymenobacter sp. BRD67]|uniref:GH3 auxin-responsive promoter family protein n=1 Tax=Hymenobacter sp. BRD67 TaxID=2675877 RepID=UPI0015659A36|nr:GH3 auxin-responsive promoter family protein [Hymenobacter sp. BRD67]QKG54247.1 GH3 auxin-responsive promoter family protein [Hymenobacter sp. BRD67]
MLDQLLARAVQLGSLPRLARVRHEPLARQAAVLRYLLGRAQGTAWGQRYGYAASLSAREFARRVPVSTYEQLYPEIEKILRGQPDVLWPGPAPRWQARSSGTTNARSKYLPVTSEALHYNHYRAGRDMLALSTQLYPTQRLLQGKTLSLGGSLEASPFGAAQAGDVSALVMQSLPGWAQTLRTPPLPLALLEEWEDKIERIARHVLRQDVRVLAGVPTWMLVLLRRVLALAGAADLREVWPRLSLFLHGAVAFGPYRGLFEQLVPGGQLHYLEIYNASEGYFALQDEPGSPDLLLLLDHGIYYEFLPAEQYDSPDPRPIPLEDVTIGPSYALVISTNAGLWRYLVGDTVRFTSLRPYRVRITGRTKHFLNAFGEEVVVENAEAAIAAAAHATGCAVRDFTAAPVYFEAGPGTSRGGHEWAVELTGPPPADAARFGQLLDEELRRLNSDYDAKRHRDLALAPPHVHFVPAGTFESWLRGRGRLGGQRKVPRLANSRQVLEEVLSLMPAGPTGNDLQQ